MAPGLKLICVFLISVALFFFSNATICGSLNPYKFDTGAATMSLIYSMLFFGNEFLKILTDLDIQETDQSDEEKKF